MNAIEKAMNAVCVIQGSRTENGQKKWYNSNGVFITPFHVLTSWHCLEGLGDVTFTNVNGRSSQLLKTGKHLKKEDLDVAIAEMEDPIGDGYIPVLTSDNFTPDLHGWLLTRFNGVSADLSPKKNAVMFDAFRTFQRHDLMAAFYSTVQTGMGYSGSPIVNNQGRVISVLHGYEFRSHEEIQEAEKRKGQATDGRNQFTAPAPREFARFMRVVFDRI